MTSTLLNVRPSYVAVCLDGRRADGWRRKEYAPYKAQRQSMPNELVNQLQYLTEFNEAFGIKEFFVAGYEADDCVGSLTKLIPDNMMGQIWSQDKDYAQLVKRNIQLARPAPHGELDYHGTDWVLRSYNINPAQFADYLGLVGDDSDNIPGCAGIGKITAARLLTHYGSLEEIWRAAQKQADGGTWPFSTSVRHKILLGMENTKLSRRLAGIVTDLPTPPLTHFRWHGVNKRALVEFVRDHNLGRLMPTISRLPSLPGTHVNHHEAKMILADTRHVDTSIHHLPPLAMQLKNTYRADRIGTATTAAATNVGDLDSVALSSATSTETTVSDDAVVLDSTSNTVDVGVTLVSTSTSSLHATNTEHDVTPSLPTTSKRKSRATKKNIASMTTTHSGATASTSSSTTEFMF